jgi:hypothetical protein
MGTGVVTGSSGGIEGTIRWKATVGGGSSDWEVMIKGLAVEQIGAERNNGIKVAEHW